MTPRILLGALALVLAGCVDSDPFGFSVRRAEGAYHVQRAEGVYFLLGPVPREALSDDNIAHLAGEPYWGFQIDSLGQRDGWIVAGRGDEWLVIHAATCGWDTRPYAVRGCHVEGTLTSREARRRAAELGITLGPVEDAPLAPGAWTTFLLVVLAVVVVRFAVRALRSDPADTRTGPPAP